MIVMARQSTAGILAVLAFTLMTATSELAAQQGNTTNPPGPQATGKIVKPDSPFTGVENEVGIAVQNLCPSLVGRSKAGQNNSAQLDLQVRCTEMVVAQDANGLSGDGTANVLRAATAEEAATQGTQAVELSALRGGNIIARLTQLRTASAGGPGFAFDEGSGTATFSHDYGGSAGDETFGPWSVWLNGTLTTGDRDETENEAGFDFDGGAITFGADYRTSDNTFVGLSATWGTANADLVNGSSVDSDGFGLLGYFTTYLQNDIFVEGTLGFGSRDYDQSRRISYDVPNAGGSAVTQVRQSANSSTDSDEIVASVGVGKDINRGANNFTFSGYLTYLDIDIDGYQENISGNNAPGFGLALEVDKQSVESLRSVIGFQFSRPISTSRGVTVPFLRADWIHEFKNDQRQTRARFDNDPYTTGGFFLPDGTPASSTFALLTEDPDEDYFRLGAGVSSVWSGGWQGFAALDGLVGLKNINAYGITLGVRKDL
jgi:outer membrane lipase/esterase